MNILKKIITITMLASSTFMANANENVDAYLKSNNLILGLNDSGYIGVGSADIKLMVTEPTFGMAREMAFNKAFLAAKLNINLYMSNELSMLLRASLLEKKTDEEIALMSKKAQIDLSILKKLCAKAKAEVDSVLEGKSDSKKEFIIIDNFLKSQAFKKLISDFLSNLGGTVVYKIIEDSSKITVIASYSGNAAALSSLINSKNSSLAGANKGGQSVEDMVNNMKMSELYSSLGVQLTTDEEGGLVLLSFGQAQARNSNESNLAINKAELYANEAISDFVKSMISQSDSSMKEISSNRINGIETLRRWSFTDPRNKQIVCGVVSCLKIKNNK